MAFTVNAACGSFIGAGRCSNQDNFYFNKKHLPAPSRGITNPLQLRCTTDKPVIFAVFDGMGGECKGEEAARLSSEAFSDECRKLDELAVSGKELMHACCIRANDAVNRFRQEMQLSASGSTVAAVCLSQNEIVACNVGDSRIFRIRERKMLQISEDHTDEKLLAAMGVKKKPVLLQYIGIPQTQMTIEPYISRGELNSEDAYVLCTDGVTDELDAAELYGIVSSFAADEAVKRILEEVARRDGSDNATVIVIKIA